MAPLSPLLNLSRGNHHRRHGPLKWLWTGPLTLIFVSCQCVLHITRVIFVKVMQQYSSPQLWGPVPSFTLRSNCPLWKPFLHSAIERRSPLLTLSTSPCFIASLVLTTLWNHLFMYVLYIICLPHYNISSIQVQSLLSVSLYPQYLE